MSGLAIINPEALMLRRHILAMTGLLFSASVLSAQTPPSQPSPAVSTESSAVTSMEDPQIGDHWTYETRDDVTGEIKSTITLTISDLTPTEFAVRMEVDGKPDDRNHTFSRSWDTVSDGPWQFAPNDGGGIRPPLSVGKTWSFKSTDVNPSAGARFERTGTSKVTAQETITTRAGTFETFKIETTAESRDSKIPTRTSLYETQSWFAPAINRWAKRSFIRRSEGLVRDRRTLELVGYARKK